MIFCWVVGLGVWVGKVVLVLMMVCDVVDFGLYFFIYNVWQVGIELFFQYWVKQSVDDIFQCVIFFFGNVDVVSQCVERVYSCCSSVIGYDVIGNFGFDSVEIDYWFWFGNNFWFFFFVIDDYQIIIYCYGISVCIWFVDYVGQFEYVFCFGVWFFFSSGCFVKY